MFKELHAAYGAKGFTLVGIAMDDEGLEIVKPYVDEMKIPYLTLLGNEAMVRLARRAGYSVRTNPHDAALARLEKLLPPTVVQPRAA